MLATEAAASSREMKVRAGACGRLGVRSALSGLRLTSSNKDDAA